MSIDSLTASNIQTILKARFKPASSIILTQNHASKLDIDLAHALSSLLKACLPDPKCSRQAINESQLATFIHDSVYADQDQLTRHHLSQLLADTIWAIETEIEAQRSSLEDQLKALDPDPNLPQSSQQTINPDSPPHPSRPSLTAPRCALDRLAQSRKSLLNLSIHLLQSNQNRPPILNPDHCRLSWEYGFLHETGLLPFSSDLVAKQATRLNTGLHYKQQRFNLLREESEGYSHLATELISAMGPALVPQLVPAHSGQGDPTSYPHLRSVLVPGESPQIRDSRIDKVTNNLKALIGFFDLDPNRTLDIILDVFSYNVTTHHPFFCSLLKKSHWMKAVDGDSLSASDEQPAPADGILTSEQGSKLIASLLGFKFAHYQQADGIDPTPEELYLMTAVLIWHKIVKLRDILPHLAPDSEAIKQHESDWRQEVANKATNAGPRNALSMAGALDNSGGLGAFSKPASKPTEAASSAPSTKPKALPNQKAGLLSALLSIGALQESIFLLSLPNHQYLAHQDPNQSALLLRLIEVALTPAYIQAGLSVQQDGQPVSSSITQPQRRYVGGPGGAHQLVEPETPKASLSSKVGPRIISLSATSVKAEPVFFWNAWKDRILRAHTGSEVLDQVWPLLRFVGPFGHMHMGVFHKVAELTAAALQQRSNGVEPDPRWNHVLRWYLLPGLSMMQNCVAASNVVWKVLRTFSYEERYSIYGEWKERIYQRIPELKVERAKADAETKRVLKTMTLDNLKEKSRALAKLACSNPCIVFNAALNQVQTYDNLIACVIECLRYLNLFALDVLTYSIVEFLSNPDKDRSKSDGTNIAAWLQNLAKFVGNVFKRNLSLDPTIVLQYIANQLATGNAKDLIILRDMISKMAGIDVLQDLSASQVVALGGSKTLRAEAISPTTLTAKKLSFSKSSTRLMRALSESGLTVPLLLLVASQRQNAVLLADEGAHLKYLGVLADSCQQVLFQYIEFLRTQLASRDISDYERALPTMEQMWAKHRIDPSIIFQVWRPVLAASVRPALRIGSDGEVTTEEASKLEVLSTSSEQQSVQPVGQGEDSLATETNGLQTGDQYPSSLAPTVSLAEKMLPDQTRKLVGPHFFVTFWQLELYDIRMPDERYISETSRLNSMLSDLDREYATPMVSSMKELNRTNRSKILEIRATVTREMKIHIKHYELTRARLAAEKSYWFPLSARSPYRTQLLEHIIQHCFNPRAKLSPVDAAYTAQFIKTLHGLGTASFMTLKLFDRIFSSDVGPTIFPCSEFEASNYGRFLRDLLLLIKSWYDSESVFKKTGLGKDKKGNYLPGLRMKWANSAAEGIPESDMLSFDNLQKVVKKWTAIMSGVCKEAIQSGEYMYIRNSIAVLKELDGLVPLFEDQAKNLEGAVTELLKHEKREDVKVLAYGYQSMLKRAAKNVIKVKTASVPAVKKVDAPVSVAPTTAANGTEPKTGSTNEPNPSVVAAPPLAPPTSKPNPASNLNSPVAPAMLSKPSLPSSTVDSRPISSPTPVTPRPPGLPERPSATASRLPQQTVPRHEVDRKLLSAPARPLNGNNGQHRIGHEAEHSVVGSHEGPRPPLPPPSSIPSAQLAEREALARAAVQRSRKVAASIVPPPNHATTEPAQQLAKHPAQQAEEQRHPNAYPAHFPDRAYASSGPEQMMRPSNMVPSGPKASRPLNGAPADHHPDEPMRPPASPSAAKVDPGRREGPYYNPPSGHQAFPSHTASLMTNSNNITSPRPREELGKRVAEENMVVRHREERRNGGEERETYERSGRDEREHRRTREEPARTRPPSVESMRSIRSGREKDKRGDRSERSERSEKRKRSRSPSDRHRDHRDRDRDRDRERERDRERDREREREKDREKDRDRDRDRDRKDRDKDREVRHREKDKDVGREERDKERERGDRRSHRRDREKDERRHEKEREKEREPEGGGSGSARGGSHHLVVEEGGSKRRKVAPSGPSLSAAAAEGPLQAALDAHEPHRPVDSAHHVNGDDRHSKELVGPGAAHSSSDTKPAGGGSTYTGPGGPIPLGPRALQSQQPGANQGGMSNMRAIPTGPASSFSAGHGGDGNRGRHSNGGMVEPKHDGGGGGGSNGPASGRTTGGGQNESQRDLLSPSTRHHREGGLMGPPSGPSKAGQEAGRPSESGGGSGGHSRPGTAGEGWHLGGSKNGEPKKNISIKGMAASALQKANEDNARKDKKEVEGPVSSAGGGQQRAGEGEGVEMSGGGGGGGGKKREWESGGGPSSLLSRMDDGKKLVSDKLEAAAKRKRDEGGGEEQDGSGSRRVSLMRDEYVSPGGQRGQGLETGASGAGRGEPGEGGRGSRFGGGRHHAGGPGGGGGRGEKDHRHDKSGEGGGGRRKDRGGGEGRGGSRERPKRNHHGGGGGGGHHGRR